LRTSAPTCPSRSCSRRCPPRSPCQNSVPGPLPASERTPRRLGAVDRPFALPRLSSSRARGRVVEFGGIGLESSPMSSTLVPMPTAGRRNRMLLLVFGSGAAIGLHLGLLHLFLWRSLWAIPAFVPPSLIFAGVTYSLWRWVFPQFGSASLARRIGLESLVAVLALTCVSAVLTEAGSRLLRAPSLFGSFRGDELHITITPEMRQRSVQMYALLPIVPTALMTIIGYHQYWARVLTLQSRERELTELAATAQLAALRAQMNPHFLF